MLIWTRPPKLAQYAALLKETANEIVETTPGLEAHVEIVRQYRNMADVLCVIGPNATCRQTRNSSGGTLGKNLVDLNRKHQHH